jgi:hypothetical protein
VVAGGADRLHLGLARARVSQVDLIAGFSFVTMRLPVPAGRVDVILAGGASSVRLKLPAGTAARLSLGGGAGQVTIGGRTRAGVAGGTVLGTGGWATAVNRYYLDATAGVSLVVVTG